jgi:hypothetical protein
MKRIGIVLAVILVVTAASFAEGAAEGDSFTLAGIDSITVRAGFLDVQVIGTDGYSVRVRADLPQGFLWSSPAYHVVRERRGSRLTVSVQSDSPFGMGGRGKLYFEVPRDVVVQVQTISGSILVQGVESESCTLSAVSGTITVRDTRARLSLDNVSGSIILDSAEGSLRAKTISGSIQGKRLALTDNSSFTSVSGSVDVRLDSPLDDFRFDLSTLSGRVVIGSIRAEKGLRLGSGGVLIKGHTVSGSLIFR